MTRAREHALDGAQQVEAHDELQARDGRDQVALVETRALSSMKMMPPPTMTIMKMDMIVVPGSKYWMYGT